MNDLVRDWIVALRSGEYRRDIYHLATPAGFCCLGVACEVYKRTHPEFTYKAENSYLPAEVQLALGLKTEDGKFNPLSRASLANMNDCGASFNEIADKIENSWGFLKAVTT